MLLLLVNLNEDKTETAEIQIFPLYKNLQIKMKFLREVQKNFVILGICSNQSRINIRSVLTCLTYGLGTASSAIFLIRDANNFQEYTNNIYITTAFIVGFTYFTITVYKMKKIFILIKNLKENIKESE